MRDARLSVPGAMAFVWLTPAWRDGRPTPDNPILPYQLKWTGPGPPEEEFTENTCRYRDMPLRRWKKSRFRINMAPLLGDLFNTPDSRRRRKKEKKEKGKQEFSSKKKEIQKSTHFLHLKKKKKKKKEEEERKKHVSTANSLH